MYKEKVFGQLAVVYDSESMRLPRLTVAGGWTVVAGPVVIDWIRKLKRPVCYDYDFFVYNRNRFTVFDAMRESGHLVDGIRFEVVARIIVKVANRFRIKQDRQH